MPVPTVNPQLRPWNAIDSQDTEYVWHALFGMKDGGQPTSGFLAGGHSGGPLIQRLEEQWATTFHVKHAITFNSGTSALLAACYACGFGKGMNICVPSLSMSATASTPAFLGANLVWADTDDNLNATPEGLSDAHVDGVLITNLFGYPADLEQWLDYCGERGIPLIEDNCQAPFARYNGCYTGTIGDIGVFSLNVHKHMQVGEGGVAVTDDDDFATRLRLFRNHGEVLGPFSSHSRTRERLGLNLRMTELTAAMALSQLAKGQEAVRRTQRIAGALIDELHHVEEIEIGPNESQEVEGVYYALPILFRSRDRRDTLVASLRNQGVPITPGYGSGPLYRLPALAAHTSKSNFGGCPKAEEAEGRLGILELCAWDFTPQAIAQIGDAFRAIR